MLTLFRLFLPRIFIKLLIPTLITAALCVVLGKKSTWPMIIYPATWILVIYSQYLSRTIFSRNLNWIALLPKTRTKLHSFAIALNITSAGIAVTFALLLNLATYACLVQKNKPLSEWEASSILDFLFRPDLLVGVYVYYAFLYSMLFWPTDNQSTKDGVIRAAKYFFGLLIILILLVKLNAPYYFGPGYFALVVLFIAPLLLAASSAKLWQVHAQIRKKWLIRSTMISSVVAGILIAYSIWCIFASTDLRHFWAMRTWRLNGVILTSEQMKKILVSDLDASAWRDATSLNDNRFGFDNRPSLSALLDKSDPEAIRAIASFYSLRKVSIEDLVAYGRVRDQPEDDWSNLLDAVKWSRSDFRDQDITTLTKNSDAFLRLVGLSHILINQKYERLDETLLNWKPGVFQDIDTIVNNLREFSQSLSAEKSFQLSDTQCIKIVKPNSQNTLGISPGKISYCLKFLTAKHLTSPEKHLKDTHFGRIDHARFSDWIKAQSISFVEISRLPHVSTEEFASTKAWARTLRALTQNPLTQPTQVQMQRKRDYHSFKRADCSWNDHFSARGISTSAMLALSPLLTPAYPLALMLYQDNFGSFEDYSSID